MLKLTDSLCRYIIASCIHYNKSCVSRYSHFATRREVYCADHSPCPLFSGHFSHSSHWLKSFPIIKINPQPKKLFDKCNELKQRKRKKMSESVQPSLSHVSYGGQFDISENVNPIENWRKPNEGKSSQVRAVPEDFRVWETTEKECASKSIKFRIVSYNVLAQYLLECHPYLYTDCAPRNLKWKVRAPKLYDEILELKPDIICLQEVQESHLNNFYNKFEDIGYSGIYKQKTGDRRDGCAIYFKQSVFELQDQISVEFYQPELPILNRDNIGIMVKLIPRSPPRTPIVVATTHLLYNPKRTDVRLAQMQLFLAEIDRFAYFNNGRDDYGYLPIILTGDLNSTPDTAVIKLLEQGCVSTNALRDTSDWKKIGVTDSCQHLRVYIDRLQGKRTDFSDVQIHHSDFSPTLESTAEEAPHSFKQFFELESKLSSSSKVKPDMNFDSGFLRHKLNLKSVYPIIKPNGLHEATTFQDYWITVDYIYFSNLRLIERLRLPTTSECEVLGKLPNDTYGSDHLALAAGFEVNSIEHM